MLQVPGYMLVTIISVEVDLEKTFSSLPVVSPLAASRWLAKYQPRKEARCRPLGHLEGRWNEMEDLSLQPGGFLKKVYIIYLWDWSSYMYRVAVHVTSCIAFDRWIRHHMVGSSERTCEKVHAFAVANFKLVAEQSFWGCFYHVDPFASSGEMSALLETLRFKHEPAQGSTTTMEGPWHRRQIRYPSVQWRTNDAPRVCVPCENTDWQGESKMSKDELEKLGPPRLALGGRTSVQAVLWGWHSSWTSRFFHQRMDQRNWSRSSIRPSNHAEHREARELYSAGSREGGMLSRQVGESMASYVSRRRAWWSALQGLDSELKIPEVILAEQILVNSNITDDQKLMVRTMLQGTLTVENVAAELLSQHGTIPWQGEVPQRQRRW